MSNDNGIETTPRKVVLQFGHTRVGEPTTAEHEKHSLRPLPHFASADFRLKRSWRSCSSRRLDV